jgi:hypothetical protein
MVPKGLTNQFISSFLRSSPELIFLIFGRRSLIPSVTFFAEVFSPRFFAYCIDKSVKMLFGWSSLTMSYDTKTNVYQHLYSTCSVKTMLHWFQFISHRRFAMFDDEISKQVNVSADDDVHVVPEEEDVVLSHVEKPRVVRYPLVTHVTPRFATEQIQNVPIALFYGGIDTLMNMSWLLKSLRAPLSVPMFLDQVSAPSEPILVVDRLWNQVKTPAVSPASPLVYLKCIPLYEHICLLWADDASDQVFDDAMRILEHLHDKKK